MPNLVDACIFVPAASGVADFVVSVPVIGWRTPAQAGAVNGKVYEYRAYSADNTQWELGSGVYTAAGTVLARTTIMASSNGGAKVAFTNPPSVALTAYSADFATTAQLAKIDNISITQPVDLDQVEADVAASKTKTDFITITQPVNLDQVEADTATALANANAAKTKTDWITVTQPVNLDQIEADAANSKAVTQWITVTQPVNLDQIEADAAASKTVTSWVTVTQPVNLDTMESDIAANNAKVSFPEAPTDSQQYARKNAAWVVVAGGGGGATTYIGDTPPASPTVGQLWWESDSGSLFIWYDDGNTAQWVETGVDTGGGGGSGSSAAATFIGDNPPASPIAGQLWFESDSGNTFIYYDDGNTKQWVQINVPAYMAGSYLPLAGGEITGDLAVDGNLTEQGHRLVRKDGDTMTGVLSVSMASPSISLMKSASGQTAAIFGYNATKLRWSIHMGDTVAESGGNVGSNFDIYSVDDAGTTPFLALSIKRDTNAIALGAGQLIFPATANPATGIYTLDDYREGSFVPTLQFGSGSVGMTYSQRTGRYTKIGNIVHWSIYIVLTAKGTSTGNASILGLPFTVAANHSFYPSGMGYFNVTPSTAIVTAALPASSTGMNLYNTGGFLTDANVGNTTSFSIGGSYETAS